MDKKELQKRLKIIAVKYGRLCLRLPYNPVNKVYFDQLIRSSSSSAANYRSACRAKSKADFVTKLKIVEEELDETMFFYELLAEFNPVTKKELQKRFKGLAVKTAKLCFKLPFNSANKVYIDQITRNSASSNIIKENTRKIRNPESKI